LRGRTGSEGAYFQVLHDQDFIGRDAQIIQQDGVKRPQHNPRLNSLAHEIPVAISTTAMGSCWPRVPGMSWSGRRAEYDKLAVNIDTACSRADNRLYPFGSATAHLLGDCAPVRTSAPRTLPW